MNGDGNNYTVNRTGPPLTFSNRLADKQGPGPCISAQHPLRLQLLTSRAFQFAILIDSIRYANKFESIRFVKNRPFESLVVMQFLVYLLYRLSQRISWRHCLRSLILQNIDKNSYAMHSIKLLLTYYLNISVQAANLSDRRIESNRNNRFGSENRIESKLFCPNWNALLTRQSYTADFAPVRNSQWVLPVFIVQQNLVGICRYMYYYAEAAETFIKCRQKTTKYYNAKRVFF